MKTVRAVLTVMIELKVPDKFTEEEIFLEFNELSYDFSISEGECSVTDSEVRDIVLTQRG